MVQYLLVAIGDKGEVLGQLVLACDFAGLGDVLAKARVDYPGAVRIVLDVAC